MRKQLLTLDHLVQLMDPKLYLHLQSADSTNFFFFFRMLLVWYKREFAWLDILHLWEVLWTDYLSSGFHLFIALAILEKHRGVIMEHLKHFDEVLKYINELSTTIDLESTLIRAEALFRRFQRTVEAIDKKSNFPAPKLRQRQPTRNASIGFVQSLNSNSPASPVRPNSAGSDAAKTKASTSGMDAVSANGTNSGLDKGKSKTTEVVGDGGGGGAGGTGEELQDQRPKVISPELRGLLSRKVEILPRKVVRKEGEGLSKLKSAHSK